MKVNKTVSLLKYLELWNSQTSVVIFLGQIESVKNWLPECSIVLIYLHQPTQKEMLE